MENRIETTDQSSQRVATYELGRRLNDAKDVEAGAESTPLQPLASTQGATQGNSDKQEFLRQLK